ncbi:MAG TPA: hypothetical protein VEJ46_15885 [Candidatus Acidoferrum sp.]|nr:hypothetical protein [Candidatus Acidoferrum sp.]
MTATESDFAPAIKAIIDKYENEVLPNHLKWGDFSSDDERERHRKQQERELWLFRVHLLGAHLEDAPPIDLEDAEGLQQNLANKLAMSAAKTVQPEDWWWTPAEGLLLLLLEEVHESLEKATRVKVRPWRRSLFWVWCFLSELLYLAIVIGLFVAASSKFEVLAFAVLVMIYNAISSRVSGIGLGLAWLAYRVEEAYGEIGRTLKLKVPVFSVDEVQKQLERSKLTILIHNVSIGIGSLIALWHLVMAMLS